MARTNKQKERFLKALSEHLGNISAACKAVGIDRGSHYKWIKSDPAYKEAVEQILDEQGDLVESKLIQAIREGDTTAIIFYCKTKLKGRGYTEKSEVSLSGDMTIDVQFSE